MGDLLSVGVPHALELGREGVSERRVRQHHDVLAVVERGLARPVVGAREQQRVVEHDELVVHVVGRVVDLAHDAGGLETRNVRALRLGLVVVGDNAHMHAALVHRDDGIGDLVTRDAEDADVGRGACARKVAQEARQTRGSVSVGARGATLALLAAGERATRQLLVRKEDHLLSHWCGCLVGGLSQQVDGR